MGGYCCHMASQLYLENIWQVIVGNAWRKVQRNSIALTRTICAYQHQFGELSSDPKYIRDTGKDSAALK